MKDVQQTKACHAMLWQSVMQMQRCAYQVGRQYKHQGAYICVEQEVEEEVEREQDHQQCLHMTVLLCAIYNALLLQNLIQDPGQLGRRLHL